MKNATFKFELVSQGRLANVFFFPEQESSTIILETDSSKKEWINEEFELLIEDPFEYKLQVFGVSGTEWKAELSLISDGDAVKFMTWKGITGDTRRNISERTKPIKNLPTSI